MCAVRRAARGAAAAVLALGLLLAGCGGGGGAGGASGGSGARGDGGAGRALSDEDMVAWGRSMYRPLCASCHGQNGEGASAAALNRADLREKYPTRAALAKRIAEGDPAAGMPACARDLEPRQLEAIAAYVMSLAR